MNFFCDGCERISPHIDLKRCVITAERESRFLRFCRFCCDQTASVPDVFWDGKPEINLADGPDGKPVTFSSKHEKARYLNEHGLREAGDKYHGAPISAVEMEKKHAEQMKQKGRVQVKETISRIMKMKPEERHREFLRVTNQRGR